MQRRGGSGQPVKGQSANRPKARNTPTAQVSPADLQEQLDRRTRERDEALEQLAATSEVLRVISRSAFDLQAVFDTLVESAAQLCGADYAAIRLGRDGFFHQVASYGYTPEQHQYMNEHPVPAKPDQGSIVGRVLSAGKTTQIEDTKADPEFRMTNIPGFENVHTHLGVPLLREGKPIGVLVLMRGFVETFTDKQIELVESFAAQAVIAIENTRLLNELRQRTDDLSEALEQQTATSEVLQVISRSPGELEPVFNAMLANATRICEATFGNLLLREGPVFRSVAVHSTKRHAESWRRNPVIDLRDNPGISLDRVAKTKQVVHIPDLRIDESYVTRNDRVVTLVEVAGARTQVTVPMLKEGELIGAIAMYRQEVRPFTDKQIELVKNFAAQAVIAIENTRLLNELRESLQQQTASAEVLKVISSSPGELEPVFQAMLANAVRICEAKFGGLVLFEGNAYRRVALHNAPAAYVEAQAQDPVRPLAASPTLSRVAGTKRVIHIADIRVEQPEEAIAVLGGARAILCVPMLKDDQVVGVISIYRQEVRPFTDKQIELVTNFAAQAVIAIENTRLLNELRESLQQQTATADVLKVISRSAFNLQTVLDTLVESAARLCDADSASIHRTQDEAYPCIASYGLSPEFQQYLRDHPVARGRGSVLGRVVREGRTIHVPDVLADAEHALVEQRKLGGYRTVLGVPLRREGDVIGLIRLNSQQGPTFHRQANRAGHHVRRPSRNRN